MRAKSLVVGLFLSVYLFSAARAEVSVEEWKVLQRGEVVAAETVTIKPDGTAATDVLVKIWIKAPREKVWATLRDYDKFGEFMPRVKNCRLVSREGETYLVLYETEVLGVWVIYHIEAVGAQKNRRIEFHLAEEQKNDIKQARGYWQLDDAPGGGTVLSYSAYIETGVPMPEALARKISKPNMVQVIKNVRSRVESDNTWKKGQEDAGQP